MRKDSWFRGALLSVLFFGVIAGPAPSIAMVLIEGSDGDEITVTPNYEGTPGAPNPTDPRSGFVVGVGMGPRVNYIWIDKNRLASTIAKVLGAASAAMASVDAACSRVASTRTLVALAALGVAIVAALVALGQNYPGAAVLAAVAAVGFASHAAADSFCTNEWSSFRSQNSW